MSFISIISKNGGFEKKLSGYFPCNKYIVRLKVGLNNWGSFYLSWIIAFEWNIRCLRCDITDNETRLSTMYAIRLYSKDNDDLRRGTDNDDEMKMYEKYRCKVNMWENSFDGNCIRLGRRIEAEFVPRPSLYSPINDNEYSYYFQYELCKNLPLYFRLLNIQFAYL